MSDLHALVDSLFESDHDYAWYVAGVNGRGATYWAGPWETRVVYDWAPEFERSRMWMGVFWGCAV